MSRKAKLANSRPRAARLLRPRHVVWVESDGPFDVLESPGFNLVFGAPPDALPPGVVSVASAPGVFAVEVLPR
jgi:hypothetical protein